MNWQAEIARIIDTKFGHLASQARIWIYQSNRSFTPSESEALQTAISDFVSQWQAHQVPVGGAGAVFFDRFIVLAADEQKVSGCSIDTTVHLIKQQGEKFGIDFFDRFYVCIAKAHTIEGFNQAAFRHALASGNCTSQSLVFNNTITKLDLLRQKWLVPVANSWLRRFVVDMPTT